jgi:hypothetical protein
LPVKVGVLAAAFFDMLSPDQRQHYMYFWRIKRLKDDLRAGDVPLRQVTGYALAHLLLWTLSTSLLAFIPAEDSRTFTADFGVFILGSMLASIAGLWAAYRSNGGDGGRDLAGRLFALGWVLGLRFMLFWFVLFTVLIFVVVGVTMAQQESPETADVSGPLIEWVASGTMLLASVLFFWRLAHHLKALRIGSMDA